MTSRKVLRVLDLGAHDGFITAHWLPKQMPEDVRLRIDGVELHPLAVKQFNRRLKAAGLPGTCKRGDAHDAAKLFKPGSYDAVVLYELVEHVPDVGRLLSVAERMLAPNGRIYVSTPDGAFGEGGNPHHLRAWRSIDLADELRRRGTLLELGVGEDTITHAAYQPRDRGRGEAAIFTGPAIDPWSARDINGRGLGGSETAAVHLADELSERGWVVTVYGDVEQGAYGDVVYRNHQVFDPLAPRDLVIASRMPELADRPMRAKTRLLWMHDTDCGSRLTERRARGFDHVLTLSEWHAAHVRGLYPFLGSRVVQIRNGIDLSRFTVPLAEGDGLVAREKRVLYTSSPDRGLDIILSLWPQVRKEVPDAELAFCYSPVYWRAADLDPIVGAHAKRIEELADQPGVLNLRSLGQGELARAMRTSMVWVAPSYNTPHDCPFHETSCIGAMEAQAAGCWVVASGWGALPETVRIGELVDGEPLSDQWKQAFVDGMVRGLTHAPAQEWAQEQGPNVAADLGWDGVAAMVEDLCAPRRAAAA